MKIEYTLLQDDYVAFNLYYARHDPAFMRRVRMMQGIGAAVLLGMGVAVGLLRGGVTGMGMAFFVLIAVLFVLFVSNQARSAVEKRVRLAADRAQGIPQGARTVMFDGDTLCLRDQAGEQTIPFDTIDQAVRTKTHLFIMTHAREVVVIPLAAFASLDDAQQFYSALPNSRTEGG